MRALVYGWYQNHNLGDDLFVPAIQGLFPELDCKFVNHIKGDDLQLSNLAIFGGGSILEGILSCESGAAELLKEKPVVHLGVGTETRIHDSHKEVLCRSRLVATRSPIETLSGVGAPVMSIPDLVYSLPAPRKALPRKGVLVLPNVSVVPSMYHPHWMHAAWNYFKCEFSQALDDLIDAGKPITLMPMCCNQRLNDEWAAAEILNGMRNRDESILHREAPTTFEEAIGKFSQYEVVVTQRFHGRVLANLSGTPCVTIWHHDKLKHPKGVSYYESSKSALLNAVRSARPEVLPPQEPFSLLQEEVRRIIKEYVK